MEADLQYAWDHDLKRVRDEMVREARWGVEDDGDEGWACLEWESLPLDLRGALAPLIQARLAALETDGG